MVRVSVIVPVYNVEPYLRQCVDSILNQTFTDFELLLVDDGSTDRSGAICDEYASLDARVKVFHTTNRGVSAARNLGIDEASAEWITFVDSDDWVERDYLKSFLKHKLSHDCIVYQGLMLDYQSISQNNKTFVQYEEVILKNEQLLTGIVQYRVLNDGFIAAKLFNKNLIINNGIRFWEDISICEDLLFIQDYLSRVKEIQLCSSVLYHYVRGVGVTLTMRYHPSEEYILVFNRLQRGFAAFLLNKPINDVLFLKEMNTLHGLSQLVVACRVANRKNFSYVYKYIRSKKHLFDEYYIPMGYKHVLFQKFFFVQWIPKWMIFLIFRLLAIKK